ncbi:hypothetical protein Slin15195_G005110 [Septoria linicola]|uniref:Uncharacterized protein n=1 Tax=Septoria linicola TaxID=215465 RepID=A0A9Q9EF26_9PEZI|nr:hypothetical protein Slin14017_G005150 [Septoria linicola]USW47192.1 hypothetical protein Slin15195_G005110 [Septoria linicola]
MTIIPDKVNCLSPHILVLLVKKEDQKLDCIPRSLTSSMYRRHARVAHIEKPSKTLAFTNRTPILASREVDGAALLKKRWTLPATLNGQLTSVSPEESEGVDIATLADCEEITTGYCKLNIHTGIRSKRLEPKLMFKQSTPSTLPTVWQPESSERSELTSSLDAAGDLSARGTEPVSVVEEEPGAEQRHPGSHQSLGHDYQVSGDVSPQSATVSIAFPQRPSSYASISTTITPAGPASTPLSNEEFSLVMRIPWPYDNPTQAAIVATKNDSHDDLLLVAERLAAYPGTPAYINNTLPKDKNGVDYVSLNMDVNGTSYGLSAASVGSAYGRATTVLAVKGQQQEEWTVGSTIWHKMAAASNLLLACNETVNGEPAVVLSWGIYYSNGSAPAGCAFTSVWRNCDVLGSEATCSETDSGQ